MLIEGSAINAMSALRGQIEERLLHNEDYRSLRALDKAIAEVKAPPSKAIASIPAAAIPSSSPAEEVTIMDQHGHLQQKIAERFSSAAA